MKNTSIGSMPKNVRKHVLHSTNKVNIILFLSGIVNSLLFWYYDATVMFYYSILMMIVFGYACICLKNGKKMQYVLLVFLGIFFYMIFSVIFLGWEFGFQHYCIGLAASLIFTDYYLYREKKLSKRSIYMATAVVLIYISLRIWTYYHPYIYPIENEILVKGVYILNSIVGFSFMIMYLCIYSNTVRRLEYELLDMANIDPLTGISNRRKMHEMLKLAFGDGENKKICAAIAMLDIDYFKKVNDTYGHEAGDEVLVTLANILNAKQKENNDFHVCRWGGEEFLLLYEGHDVNKDEIVHEFEKLRQLVQNTVISYKNIEIKITVTIGLAFYNNGITVQQLINAADDNLYVGKKAGRNRVVY